MVKIHPDFAWCKVCESHVTELSPERRHHYAHGAGTVYAMSFCQCPEGQRLKKVFKLTQLITGG